ncbi:MAG: DNA polymerase III subunit gamma/tau [Acidobacteria bacterium]|nr:DNA polymerase III subunit gamma/tau [Acidobacteriota bacterium]
MASGPSSYVVIARKWRPQTFEDVVGQKIIMQTLQNALRSNRIAHAFIFSGARGVGKTTAARILAKALNCHRGPTPQPCGECVSCKEIAAGNSLDVLEIDAASNTGVENIRELRETLQYRSARDRFKIFIVDEVHMLSNAAFNALLKTLEEPPEHVKFIMATTESHRVPVTILSRCQQFEFKMIPGQQILDRLRVIAQAEEIQISDYALRLICSASEGSMRDAQSALDQVLAFSGRQVNDEDVRSLLGVVPEESLNAVVAALIGRDRKAMLDQLSRIAGHGHSLQVFCRKLVQHFRHLLVIKAAGFEPELIPVSASQGEYLRGQAEQFSEMDLLRIYDLLFRAEGELRWHPTPLFHLEITLLKVLQLPHLEEIEKVLSGLVPLTARDASVQNPGASRPASFDALAGRNQKAATGRGAPLQTGELEIALKKQSSAGGPGVEERAQSRELIPPEAERSHPNSAEASDTGLQIQRLLDSVHQERPALSAFLEKAQIRIEAGRLLIRFSEKQRMNRQFAEQIDSVEFLRELCTRIFGAPMEVCVEMEGPSQEPPPAGRKHRALEDPRVRLFTEAFPGKISIEDIRGTESERDE